MPTADGIAAPHHAAEQGTVRTRRQIADAGRADVVMGWARGTLTVASTAVLLLVIARVSLGRSLFEALNLSGQPGSFAGEVAEFTAAVLPGMLVAWCLGFAAAATAVRVTALEARVAGILAGVVGVAVGSALIVLSR